MKHAITAGRWNTHRAATGALEQRPLLVGRLVRGVRSAGGTARTPAAARPPEELRHDAQTAAAAAAATATAQAAQPPFQFGAIRVGGGRHGRRGYAEGADRAGRRESFLRPSTATHPPPVPPPFLRAYRSDVGNGGRRRRRRRSGRPLPAATPAAQPRPTFPRGRPTL